MILQLDRGASCIKDCKAFRLKDDRLREMEKLRMHRKLPHA